MFDTMRMDAIVEIFTFPQMEWYKLNAWSLLVLWYGRPYCPTSCIHGQSREQLPLILSKQLSTTQGGGMDTGQGWGRVPNKWTMPRAG